MLIPAAAASRPSALHLTGLCSAVDGGREFLSLAWLAGGVCGLNETEYQFETRELGYRGMPNCSMLAKVLCDVVQAASRPIDRWSISVFRVLLITESFCIVAPFRPKVTISG